MFRLRLTKNFKKILGIGYQHTQAESQFSLSLICFFSGENSINKSKRNIKLKYIKLKNFFKKFSLAPKSRRSRKKKKIVISLNNAIPFSIPALF